MTDYHVEFRDAFDAARKHAREMYPEESCGLVAQGKYIACENIAKDPSYHLSDDPDCGCRLCAFEIDPHTYMAAGDVQMVLHSHPGGPLYPSARDMQGQIDTAVTWGIIGLDEERLGDPILWGAMPTPPLVGRAFVHGITDCYTLIRDAYALGRFGMIAQGIDTWPHPPIILPEIARNDSWWNSDADLYEDNLKKQGFIEIPREIAGAGDGFLIKIRSDKCNHGGLLISSDLILHHLPSRLSRREPSGIWARQVEKFIRYVGPEKSNA